MEWTIYWSCIFRFMHHTHFRKICAYFRNIHTIKCNIYLQQLKKMHHKKTREIKKHGFIHDFVSLLKIITNSEKGYHQNWTFVFFIIKSSNVMENNSLDPLRSPGLTIIVFRLQLLQIITFYISARLGGPSNCSNKTLFEMN